MNEKDSAELQERKRRVEFIFRELHFELEDLETNDISYTAFFHDDTGFEGQLFIDSRCNFCELALLFSFSLHFQDYLRNKMEDIFQICYEFGLYVNFSTSANEMILGVYSKIYYSGLSYAYVKESLNDFKQAGLYLGELFDIRNEDTKNENR